MSELRLQPRSSGIADVAGFRLNGAAADIRGKGDDRLDVALIVSDAPAASAGVFTRNAFAAAPVALCREVLRGGSRVRAVVANSGNANACTGERGHGDAERMQALAAEAAGCEAGEVFVCSTGRIGEALPMDRLGRGIALAGADLGSTATHGERAADAILTSDTRRKVATARVMTAAGTFTVAGMAKGAGMIEPGMATMLAFLATDAMVAPGGLRKALGDAVDTTFNAITVDGDMSTNDTVLLLANGASGVRPAGGDLARFREAVRLVCDALAEKIVGDGEKITKVVELLVGGAASRADAEAVARAIGNSLLVKSSWYGNDPNWGRILDAAGYAHAAFDPARVALAYAASAKHKPVPVFAAGTAAAQNKPRWKKIVARPRFTIRLDLGAGRHAYRLLSADLTEGYVNFNKSE
ncbi:MAG: bifunctional glutamate N-acetyltransferase/amino-acid acetyltransferase ArgJ [Opitutales bacterium]|nr:bifunctional glutamate N-acetyltransferase/amino-acid acetyltransferase ArgJ [Opitutales bacterium]